MNYGDARDAAAGADLLAGAGAAGAKTGGLVGFVIGSAAFVGGVFVSNIVTNSYKDMYREQIQAIKARLEEIQAEEDGIC
jgi:hypothetical protein